AGVEALVLRGVVDQDALFFLEDIVHDRPADRDLLVAVDLFTPADRLGLVLATVGVAEHDAAAVGADRFEDQLHDPFEELIGVQDVAGGLDGLVHDAEVGQRSLEPGAAGGLLGLGEDPAAFGLGDRLDDGGGYVHVLTGDEANAV